MKNIPMERAMGRVYRWIPSLGCLSLLVVTGFYLVEDIRGWWSWNHSHRRQEKIYSSLSPAPVSDSENFAAAQVFAQVCLPWSRKPKSLNWGHREVKLISDNYAWLSGQKVNVSAWLKANGANKPEEFFAPYEQLIHQLREASKRPKCRMPVDYAKGELPSLVGVRSVGRVVRLRALFRIREKQGALALEDVLTLLRLARHVRSEPGLIPWLVGSALGQMALQPIWEGTRSHCWSSAELAALQDELSQIDLLGTWGNAIQMERWIGLDVARYGGWEVQYRGIGDKPSLRRLLGFLLLPKGWVYRTLLERDQYLSRNFLTPVDSRLHRIDRGVDRLLDLPTDAAVSESQNPFGWSPGMGDDGPTPNLLQQLPSMARTQSGLDMALVACALERVRLESGSYPERLVDLPGQILSAPPSDVCTGRPLRYRRLARGYLLYAEGWDGLDGGGVPADPMGERKVREPGDWVWAVAP